ncbi:MAG: carboxypeptidase-like regulatory domain-containing protein, partial [Bacteroidales bacterium]|nr:carboxypeptidase-like regulatory domain-containing protein [Bacteroidales bacterium]
MKKIYSFILIISVCLSTWAQGYEFKARLVNTQKEALKGAMVVSPKAEKAAISDENGYFTLSLKDGYALVSITCDGYYPVEIPVNEASKESTIVMIPESWEKYSAESSLNKKDMRQAMSIDQALKGNGPGLQVVSKS